MSDIWPDKHIAYLKRNYNTERSFLRHNYVFIMYSVCWVNPLHWHFIVIIFVSIPVIWRLGGVISEIYIWFHNNDLYKMIGSLCQNLTHFSLVTPYGVRDLLSMMTSTNGNIFRVTGPLCGEFTGPGEFPVQRPVAGIFDVFFDLRLNKQLSKQSWGWWFETPSWSLWRHCNV